MVDSEGASLHDSLNAFFVSPDIEPLFRYESFKKTTKSEFFDFINSILKTPLTHPEVEAFLYHCNESGQFFRLNRYRGDISRVDAGWEDVDKMPVAGRQRLSIRRKPTGADDLEKWLQKNKDERGLVAGNRDMAFDSFVLMLRSYNPAHKLSLTKTKLKSW